MYPWNTPTSRPHAKPRALLDSNIWRYVADAQAGGRLAIAARDGRYDVQIAPAVVYEALRLEDVDLRRILIRSMTDRRFHRLMPEAFSESMEILREIERIRPHWLRTDQAALAFFKRLQHDWQSKTSGFWRRCAENPAQEAAWLISSGDAEMVAGGREQAANARQEMRDAGWKRNPPMNGTMVAFRGPMPGWDGDMFDAWRLDSFVGMTWALQRSGNAYRDWLCPFIDTESGLLSSADWLRFWVYDADALHVPRQWMRWAHSFAQRFRKVTPGTPADSQLATYFLETDIVVSADGALLDILDECRSYSPTSLPRGERVPGGPKGVEHIMTFLSSVPSV